MNLTEQILSQVPGNALEGLRRIDRLWQSLKDDTIAIPQVVKQSDLPLGTLDWDVVICGGTLGILIGAALANLGWRVAVIERGILRGRDQEWNISRKELEVFLELNLLTEEELEKAIATQYNPARVGFLGGKDIWVTDILNIGIDPVYLLETLKLKFLSAGGKLLENSPFQSAVIHPDGILVEASETLKTRLLVDAMGNFSPIVQQARQGQKPDSVCLVVGTCAKGFPENKTGDLIYSFTPLENQCQYFWEAFPARDGRTTYMFTYLDATPQRPSLEEFFSEYLRLLPEYQKVELSQLEFVRALFGFFPSYRQSPVKIPFDRILPVGDSSGAQSPLSFGGFGAMVRHLQRLTNGIHQALECDRLTQNDLSLLQPYQPNLAVTWLFQRTMSVGINQKVAPEQINQLLSAVFSEMENLGDSVLRPFLQDVVQFTALTKALLKTQLSHPEIVIKIIPQVGILALIDWLVHYFNLAAYSALNQLGTSIQPWIKELPPVPKYYLQRWIDAWKYGSGGDY